MNTLNKWIEINRNNLINHPVKDWTYPYFILKKVQVNLSAIFFNPLHSPSA